jgi:hypothetical protein
MPRLPNYFPFPPYPYRRNSFFYKPASPRVNYSPYRPSPVSHPTMSPSYFNNSNLGHCSEPMGNISGRNPNYSSNNCSSSCVSEQCSHLQNCDLEDDEDKVWLDLFGIKLHFDDVLILGLLFFLYKEEVKDEGLFLSLVMLLIS